MKKHVTILFLFLFTTNSFADEGMWPLPVINQRIADMQALGLKLQDVDIYHPDSSSLKDAVVQFGRGCTGELISPDGLLITNHHCGYSQIQSHSTVEQDYLTDGFWAGTQAKELPCAGLTVTFIEKIEDVTEQVMKVLAEEEDSLSMNYLSPSFLNGIARTLVGEETLSKHPWMEVEIKPFYGGNQYYLFTKKIYQDVRLVGAPPSAVGKFGADTDNWMWPRHAGDFSFFRIYAGADGNPADYSKNNIPLKSKRWLKISMQGVEKDDFAMILGFPGRTNQFYTSWEVAERRDIDNSVRIHFRELRQHALLDEMLKDEQVRIQYSGKYASSTNAYKNAIGSNWAIGKMGFEEEKKKRQNELAAWATRTMHPEYIRAMQDIEEMIATRADLRRRRWILDEAIVLGVEFAKAPIVTDSFIEALQGEDEALRETELNKLEQAYHAFFNKNYAPEVDRRVAKLMLAEYLRWIPEENQPAYFKVISTQFNGDVGAFVDHLFEQSIFGSEANWQRFRALPKAEQASNDPMSLFAQAVKEEGVALRAALKEFDAAYAVAHRSFVKGLLEMGGNEQLFPEANLTLRLTYGKVKGYDPRNAVSYSHQTTLEGVMEKEDSTNWEFVVPMKLKELYDKQEFGPYALADGRMPVCFSATTHTTGGNSGSPVINGSGELIGLNFDRNWEGVGGDIQYLPDYQRSIIVDIRYVLFILDKYADAAYLLDEMELVYPSDRESQES